MATFNRTVSEIRDATLPYYFSRFDLKSTTSLLSFNHPKKFHSSFSEKNINSADDVKLLSVKSSDGKNQNNSTSSYFMKKCSFNDNLLLEENEENVLATNLKLKLHAQSSYPTGASSDESKNSYDNSNNFALFASQQNVEKPSALIGNANSKWMKLRNSVKMTNAFSSNYLKKPPFDREDSFLKKFSTRQGSGMTKENNSSFYNIKEQSCSDFDKMKDEQVALKKKNEFKFIFGPDDTILLVWLSILTVSILYNLWTCIAREAFTEIYSSHLAVWIATDVLCDLIYFFDIFVQFRTSFLEHGLVVYDHKKLNRRYSHSKDFYLDIISLTPLDLLQIYTGIHPILRFPRFLKAYRLYRFGYMVETRTAYPNMWRVTNLSHVLFLGCHWFAAFYFLMSRHENFSTSWGYSVIDDDLNSAAQKYLHSLYWSTLTLTTIGDMPCPETNWQFVFTIMSYLIGVFVFATIVGQVGNVITNRNASRQEFEKHLDGAKTYMRNHSVPIDMQKRVQRWYDYSWSRGRMNGGGDVNSLGLLPDKLRTELALYVNLETLKKVTIFQECEPEFLHDLVLKMRAFIFTPADLICRKGEVAREMFIIADGLIEVVSDSGEVLKQMNAGDFFGEIGILNLDGVNKRTADVRSVGYSELFVLSRDDVLEAFKDHPDAEKLIKKYGRKRLQELDEHKKKKLNEKLDELKKQETLRNIYSPNVGNQLKTTEKWLNLTATLVNLSKSEVGLGNKLSDKSPFDNSLQNSINIEELKKSSNDSAVNDSKRASRDFDSNVDGFSDTNASILNKNLIDLISDSLHDANPRRSNDENVQKTDREIFLQSFPDLIGGVNTQDIKHFCCLLSKNIYDFCHENQISKKINKYEIRLKQLEKENEQKKILISTLTNELKKFSASEICA